MFEAADVDNSGGIDQDEFSHILAILCAQILFRMTVYYVVLILFVPYLSNKVVDRTGIPNGSYIEMAAEQVISLTVFFGAIPALWDIIDVRAHQAMTSIAQTTVTATTTTTTTLDSDKKID
jgi:hypothetical protein